MRFKFAAVTDDTTKTPILLGFTVQSVLYPTRKPIYSCVVRVAEEMTLKNGVVSKNDYDTMVTTLNNARDATWPVSIRDIDGNTKTVKFLPIPDRDRYTVVRDEKGFEQERLYTLLMQEVPLS